MIGFQALAYAMDPARELKAVLAPIHLHLAADSDVLAQAHRAAHVQVTRLALSVEEVGRVEMVRTVIPSTTVALVARVAITPVMGVAVMMDTLLIFIVIDGLIYIK